MAVDESAAEPEELFAIDYAEWRAGHRRMRAVAQNCISGIALSKDAKRSDD